MNDLEYILLTTIEVIVLIYCILHPLIWIALSIGVSLAILTSWK